MTKANIFSGFMAFSNFPYIYYYMKIKKLTPKQAKYTYYSIRERLAFNELAKHMGYMVHEVSDENGFDSWDAIYTSDKQLRCVCELKVRKHYSTDFDGRFILEKTKYDALKNNLLGRLISHIQLKPMFVMFLFDGIYIWDLDKVNPDSFGMDTLRASSVGGDMTAKDKEITLLNIKDAIKIEYVLDYDKLSFNAKTVFKYMFPSNSKDILNIE
jgi:hypothetical protein